MVYLPKAKPVTVALSGMSGEEVKYWWYDPRTGIATDNGLVAQQPGATFAPPASISSDEQTDWVLVLDDASQGFAPPGMN